MQQQQAPQQTMVQGAQSGFCGACGSSLTPGQRYCLACGEPVAPAGGTQAQPQPSRLKRMRERGASGGVTPGVAAFSVCLAVLFLAVGILVGRSSVTTSNNQQSNTSQQQSPFGGSTLNGSSGSSNGTSSGGTGTSSGSTSGDGGTVLQGSNGTSTQQGQTP